MVAPLHHLGAPAVPHWDLAPTPRPGLSRVQVHRSGEPIVVSEETCRSCGAPITWVKTESGKWMPLDPDGTSHFATCPDAAKWRKKR